MKFTCLQENLTEGLTKVYRAVPTKSELPILSNILISAEENRLKLSATNLSTTIVTHVGASIDKDGSITVPAKMLRDFVANLSTSTLEVNLKDDILQISSDATKSKFNGMSAEDYPDLPEERKDLKIIELNPQELYEAVNSVSFAASIDDSRPVFTGIYLKGDGKIITLAASDGFRLSETTIKAEGKLDEFEIIIPSKTLMDVTRVLSGTEEPIKFALDVNDNLALLTQGDTLIATRIIEGEYPDYHKIIPNETNTKVVISSQELLEAVKLTDVFAKEADSALLMKVDPKGSIEITATTQDAGEHKSKIKTEVESKDSVEIGFNSKFLLDFLNNVKTEQISISTNGNSSPCIFRPVGKDNYFHIIMPMQINGKA